MAQEPNLKPQFFVTRQNGAMVPLIAMDELPIHVQIRNVSRSLSSFDIAGMTGVGVHASRHQYYLVEGINSPRPTLRNIINASAAYNEPANALRVFKPDPAPTSALKPDMLNPLFTATPLLTASKAEGTQTAETHSLQTTSASASVTGESKDSESTATPSQRTQEPAATATNTWRENAKAPESPSQTGAKEYCSYWLRRGECDYAQQGCIYKHEMPEDLETLERLGFRDLPAWYRQRYGKGSLLVNGGRNTPSYGVADGRGPRRVGEATRRMLRNHIGGGRQVGNAQGYNNNNRVNTPLRTRPAVMPTSAVRPAAVKETKDKAQAKPAAAAPEQLINLEQHDEQDEKQSQLLSQKYASLLPERPSIFTHDLDSDTFSNGEDTMDPDMRAIQKREQAGFEEEENRKQAAWEEEQKRAQARALVAAADVSAASVTPSVAAVTPRTMVGGDKKTSHPARTAVPAPAVYIPTGPAAGTGGGRQKRHGHGHGRKLRGDKTKAHKA